jgi:hypothetical protein
MDQVKPPRVKVQISAVAPDIVDARVLLEEIILLIDRGYESAYKIHESGCFDYLLIHQEQTEDLTIK